MIQNILDPIPILLSNCKFITKQKTEFNIPRIFFGLKTTNDMSNFLIYTKNEIGLQQYKINFNCNEEEFKCIYDYIMSCGNEINIPANIKTLLIVLDNWSSLGFKYDHFASFMIKSISSMLLNEYKKKNMKMEDVINISKKLVNYQGQKTKKIVFGGIWSYLYLDDNKSFINTINNESILNEFFWYLIVTPYTIPEKILDYNSFLSKFFNNGFFSKVRTRKWKSWISFLLSVTDPNIGNSLDIKIKILYNKYIGCNSFLLWANSEVFANQISPKFGISKLNTILELDKIELSVNNIHLLQFESMLINMLLNKDIDYRGFNQNTKYLLDELITVADYYLMESHVRRIKLIKK